jgi:AcrR family transcriptional regulator
MNSPAEASAGRGGRARQRTRALLVDAALRVFARKGAGAAAIHEIAAEAGLANGTFYNYFRTREELVEAAGVQLAERFFEAITASAANVDDPAERVAIGSRRFILQAMREPVWGAALLRVWASTTVLDERAMGPMVNDLRAGRRRRRFRYKSERAAVDLVRGAVLASMRTVLERCAGAEHADDVAALIHRGLGVDADAADAIAHRSLPPLR